MFNRVSNTEKLATVLNCIGAISISDKQLETVINFCLFWVFKLHNCDDVQ